MESRLPKPKFGLKKSTSAVNINTASIINNETEQGIDKTALKKSSTTNGVNNDKDMLKKAQSTHNVASQSTIETITTRRPALERAKTHGAIIRNNKTNLKRPGTSTTTTETCENKRPNIKTSVKPLINNTKILRNTKTTTSINNNPTTSKVVTKSRAKWDFKGRLEDASSELLITKEKHKTILEKNQDLKTQLEIIKEKEKLYREEADDFKTKYTNIESELNTLKDQTINLKTKCDELNIKSKNLEDNLTTTQINLKIYEDKCKIQIIELTKNNDRLDILENQNKTYKNNITELNNLNNQLQNMVHTLDKERRQLHNTIQELKGNIRVFCRVRPKIGKEFSKGLCNIAFPDECTIEVGRSELTETSTCGGKPRGTRQEFSFDKVFPPGTSQAVIFEELSLLVQSALEGYNVCVFAYGQTGSGKTYTMEGSTGEDYEGMIPRTVKHIFEEKRQFEILGWEYKIEASFLEIYNEHIVDLLDPQQKTHEIRMTDTKGTDIYVTNLRIEEIHIPEELENCLKIAQKNRAVAATQSNERSSRSHSVARIRLIGTHKTRNEVCTGTLNLVDLAGSEKLRNEEVARTTETKNINKSLANLGNVILALLKKQDHIPYRNSKLTHLLMPSLGGNSKTLMLLNISPLDECYSETLNSLRFASNVNNCKTGNIKRTRTAII